MACVAPAPSSSSWAHALPYLDRPLRPASANWNTKFPAVSPVALYAPLPAPTLPKQRPVLRLPALASDLPARRFDPFADDPVASTSQNTPPTRGRPLTPLVVASPSPSPTTSTSAAPAAPAIKGRRRAPSFTAGCPRSASTSTILLSTPTPPPRSAALAPPVTGAPTPFHARHYPTPDARARLLARTLLHRIYAVGRPRSPYASLSLPSAGGGGLCNGYESECAGNSLDSEVETREALPGLATSAPDWREGNTIGVIGGRDSAIH
ncbi:hypothetical protein B0H17DRAFT_1140480 [Mycena rosella]|uniref:Uncharacterized protein n=1 Tax=Mycena rosella TaxID=1033263 RepID=A0AAD7D5P7_MYCRO|nr:hypothetical protein B0H17DRAFT_1140480 [Mycena rosella]